jgi:glycosyltransferase involved in cell wall biosynthesis
MTLRKSNSVYAKIIIANSEKRSGTALYRAFSAEICLKELGFDVDVRDVDSLDAACLDNVIACLFVRTPLSASVGVFIQRLRLVRATVIADFDDLIFCPELLHLWDGMNYLPDNERQIFFDRATQYQQMVKAADCVVATTLPLAEELSRYNNNVRVIRNYPLDVTRSIVVGSKNDRSNAERFIVGYYSGTLTHQADFRQCANALGKFMQQHRTVELRIVGELNIEEFADFEGIESRISHLPIMSYEAMLLDLSRCDVNIAPLQLGNRFCECKSELKYFDAALMCVPTIASPTQPFQLAIRHGVNGFLAGTMEEWFNCLENLLRDRNLPKRIGLNARRYVLSYFGKAAQLNDYRELMSFAVNSAVPPAPTF